MCRTKELPHGAAGGGCRAELLAEAADVIAVESRDWAVRRDRDEGREGSASGNYFLLSVGSCDLHDLSPLDGNCVYYIFPTSPC